MGLYDKKKMNEMADAYEGYLETRRFIIIEGISEEEYKDAVKTVKELVKKLRKGKGDEVFNRERYIKVMMNGDSDE